LESQEVAETGSLIINRAKSLRISNNNSNNINNNNNNKNNTTNTQTAAAPFSTDKPSYEIRRPRPATTTPSYGLKQSIYVPTIPQIESTTQKRTTAFVTTTVSSTTTTEVTKMIILYFYFIYKNYLC
jgi:hypothetical protein